MADETEPRIVVLDASLGDTPAERNLRRELGPETVVYKVSEGAPPPRPSHSTLPTFDGVVISGSQTAVYEDRP